MDQTTVTCGGVSMANARVKLMVILTLMIALAVVVISLADSVIQSDAGDINIAPEGELHFNTTRIQMRSPDGSWSCCGPDNDNTWSCTAGEC